ncbi:MAG: S1 RNA-binding domain-containing protein [Candidatus Omnitrophica bacterium]|nr:S1 RNA-binding domain-containing protein [Candidatus Omnitrophota bacterium]
MSWTRRINNPSEILAMGDIIEAVVLGMDKDSKKISLGIKQTEVNPWEMVDKKYPVATKVKGKVRSLSEQGVSVEIEDGIEGFVHTSDISWTRKINHPQEILKKGQKIETAVLTVDGANKKLTLGIKQLTPDPWPELTNKYPVGTVVEGHISKIVSFGLFIEIEKDIEGLVHISEIMDNIPGKMEDLFKEGDKVKVRVIKLDDAQRKIRLSMKEFQPHQSERKTTTEERDAEDKSQGGN